MAFDACRMACDSCQMGRLEFVAWKLAVGDRWFDTGKMACDDNLSLKAEIPNFKQQKRTENCLLTQKKN